MRLSSELNEALCLLKLETACPPKDKLCSLLDLTLLNENASQDEVKHLAQKGEEHQTAAICLLPQHLKYIPSISSIKKATVINFPTGRESQQHVLESLKYLIADTSVDEIDYVFPYQAYLQGMEQPAIKASQACYKLCQQHQLVFKVILETGAFPSIDTIYKASTHIINAGCDFIKSSTGKISTGATLPAAFAMLRALKDTKSEVGLKLSGGIQSLEQALAFIKLSELILEQPVDNSWFRIGTSKLLEEILIKSPS